MNIPAGINITPTVIEVSMSAQNVSADKHIVLIGIEIISASLQNVPAGKTY